MQFKTCFVMFLLALIILMVLLQMITQAIHYFTVPVTFNGLPHPQGDLPPYPGATMDNLWWFVQISDPHLSSVPKPEKASRIRDFKQFCRENLKVIDPMLVLATGDITDGAPNNSENEEDWISYKKILTSVDLPNSLVWLDVRGNHDNFDVSNQKDPNNFYRNYSVLRRYGDSSFLYELQLPFGVYSFIHVNALLATGIRRPINFFGIMDELDITDLQVLYETSRRSSSNHTIFFGHYPTVTLLAPFELHNILSNGIAYLCGHLHDLDTKKGVKQMYALQRYHSLELELEDFRKHRKYRILAFDHDLLSFTDLTFEKWPVILITNPKSAQFLAPSHEPVNKMVHSTHIRLLIFSTSPIRYVKVEIDDVALGMAESVSGGPLFVFPWKPHQYAQGLHTVSVKARDSSGHIGSASHVFSLDGSRPDQPFVTSFILMINGYLFFTVCIFVLECACVLPLVFFRRYTEPPIPGITSSSLLYGILLLVHTDGIYFPLLIIHVYPLVGPWLVGEVLGDTYGVLTLYGVFVNDKFIGDKFAMYFFIGDLLHFHIPLTLFCILHLARAFHRLPGATNGKNPAKSSRRVAEVVGIIVSLFLLKPAWSSAISRLSEFNHFYGSMSCLVSPKYTWTCIVAVYVALRCCVIGNRGKLYAKTKSSKEGLSSVSQDK